MENRKETVNADLDQEDHNPLQAVEIVEKKLTVVVIEDDLIMTDVMTIQEKEEALVEKTVLILMAEEVTEIAAIEKTLVAVVVQ